MLEHLEEGKGRDVDLLGGVELGGIGGRMAHPASAREDPMQSLHPLHILLLPSLSLPLILPRGFRTTPPPVENSSVTCDVMVNDEQADISSQRPRLLCWPSDAYQADENNSLILHNLPDPHAGAGPAGDCRRQP
ncbi:hypothetical protein GW17_00032013 [Ensete ventricosum]|nr:hypothetical protein GW17_00032013 [Ensete ventricosum]